jgi:ADP-ribosylglycohydrolase
MWRSSKPSFESRVRGCLLGGALGDAVGADIEFLSWPRIQAEHGPDGLTDAPSGPLEFTDDTQMTLFTAEGLLRMVSRGFDRGMADESAVLDHAYNRWLRTQGAGTTRWDAFIEEWPGWMLGQQHLHQLRGPGETCLSLSTFTETGRPERPPSNDSKGCGTVMRVAPVGFVEGGPYKGDLFDLAIMSAATTHGHRTAHIAAGALALIIDQISKDVPLQMTFDAVEGRLAQEWGSDETLEAIGRARSLARSGPEPSAKTVESLGGGWIAEEALAIAVYCALVVDTYDEFDRPVAQGVLLAANHSGDSDSTAAIAGNILGALCGEDALPEEWLARLEGKEIVSTVADDLAATFVAKPKVDFRSGEWTSKYPPN